MILHTVVELNLRYPQNGGIPEGTTASVKKWTRKKNVSLPSETTGQTSLTTGWGKEN